LTQEAFTFLALDPITVKGKLQAVDVFTPWGNVGVNERTAAAFEAYLKRDWDTAETIYRELAAANPGDGVAKRLLERIEAWRANPAEASDDGSVALDKL